MSKEPEKPQDGKEKGQYFNWVLSEKETTLWSNTGFL